MANLHSAGNSQRTLTHRRTRIGEQPLTEQKAPSASKPTRPEPHDMAPPVENGESNLYLESRTSEEKSNSLNAKSEFLDRISTDPSQDNTASAQSELRKSPGMSRDKPSEVFDDGFHSHSAEPRTVLQLRRDNHGAFQLDSMGIVDKQRLPPQEAVEFPTAEPDLGPGVRSIVQDRLDDEGALQVDSMGISDKQSMPPQTGPEFPAVERISAEEVVLGMYKEGTNATPTATPQQPPANAGPAQPQRPAVETPPDTRNDHKIALQMQVDESLADFEFWKKIEARLKVIVDTCCKDDDPTDKTRALYEDTKQFVQDLGKRYSHFQQDYDQRYVKADPMQGEVQNLSKLGQGNTANPFMPTGTGQTQPDLKRKPRDGDLTGLRQRYRQEVSQDADSLANASSEESEFDLSLLSQTAERLRRQTEELEKTTASNERRKRLERADSGQQFIESSDQKQTQTPRLVIKTDGNSSYD